MLESSFGDISFFIHAPRSKVPRTMRYFWIGWLRIFFKETSELWTHGAFKGADKKLIILISFFKGHKQKVEEGVD